MDFLIFLVIVLLGVGIYFWLTKFGGMEKVDQKAKQVVDKLHDKLDKHGEEPKKIGDVELTKPSPIVPPVSPPITPPPVIPEAIPTRSAIDSEVETEISVAVEEKYADIISSPNPPGPFFSPMSPEEAAIVDAWKKAHPDKA